MLAQSEINRSMIFNPLIVVASELGFPRHGPKPRANGGEAPIVRAFRRVREAGIGSVIVDSVDEDGARAAQAAGAYTVRTDLSRFERTHNYRSHSGAERIAATVNRFDRYYTHDIVVAVADDIAELRPSYLQALMYALASSEVGIAALVAPLGDCEGDDADVSKAQVAWNGQRVVHPLEGSRVGTLLDVRRRDIGAGDWYKLVPVHAWRRGALDRMVSMPPCEREFVEGTDLVRALDAGIRIDVSLVSESMHVLLTPAELAGGEIEG